MWEKAAERMRGTLGQVSYETWIGPLTFLGMEDRHSHDRGAQPIFSRLGERSLSRICCGVRSRQRLGEPVEIKLTFGKESRYAPATGERQGRSNQNGGGHRTGGSGRERAPRDASATQLALYVSGVCGGIEQSVCARGGASGS